MERKAFNELVTTTMLDTIGAVLGSSVSQAFAQYLQVHRGLSIDEIPDHLDVISTCLKDSFGVGGGTLERAFVRTLYRKTGVQLSSSERSTKVLVEELKRNLGAV